MKKVLIASIAAAATLLGSVAMASAAGYTFSNYLSVGSTGPDVSALQTWLISSGFSIPSIQSGAAQTGYFGQQTKAAVIQYQASVGLPSTGFVGPLTVAKLNSTGSTAMSAPTAATCPIGYTCTPVAGTVTTGTVTTTTAPSSITTPGVSGTLTIAASGTVANGATFNTGQMVGVAGFKLQAGPSDMQVNTLTFDFNVRPWLYFGSFSVVNQTTGQTLVASIPLSASSFTELTASEDYRLTVSGLNFVVPHGQTVNIVLNGQALSGISQSQGTYIEVIAASVRSIDGTGVVDTESLPLLAIPVANTTSIYGSVLFNGNQTANLVLSIDPASPQTQIIQTQSGSVTNNVPLVVYDIQSQNNTATLQGLTLNVGVNGLVNSVAATPSSVFNSIILQAGGNTYYGSITNGTTVGNYTSGTVVFNSQVSIPLSIGTETQLRITANVNQGVNNVTASTSLVTSSASNFVGVDSNFNTPTVQNGGTIASAVTTLSSTAAFSVAPGAAPMSSQASFVQTSQANITGNVAVTWPFTFTVTAGTSPIYISANPVTAVAITSDLVGQAASTTKPISISASTSVTGDTNGSTLGPNASGSFYVSANSSRTFTVSIQENNTNNVTTDTSAIVALTGIYYSANPTAAGVVIATTSESLYVLPNAVQSPAGVSLLTH